jgi:hypothetical protein
MGSPVRRVTRRRQISSGARAKDMCYLCDSATHITAKSASATAVVTIVPRGRLLKNQGGGEDAEAETLEKSASILDFLGDACPDEEGEEVDPLKHKPCSLMRTTLEGIVAWRDSAWAFCSSVSVSLKLVLVDIMYVATFLPIANAHSAVMVVLCILTPWFRAQRRRHYVLPAVLRGV